MSKLEDLSNAEICAVIGLRLKTERLRVGFSQATLCEMTGISLRTFKRFESNGKGQTETFVAILRALNRLRALEVSLPSPAIPPKDTLAGQIGKLRKRAKRGS